MNAQSILDHHSGCKAKHDKECVKQGGWEKAKSKKVTQEEVQVPGMKEGVLDAKLMRSPRTHKEQNTAQHPLSSPARE